LLVPFLYPEYPGLDPRAIRNTNVVLLYRVPCWQLCHHDKYLIVWLVGPQ